MANKQLFASIRGPLSPAADVTNEAGGRAYALAPEAALAQLVMTGTLGHAFYTAAATQLDELLAAANAVSPLYVAQIAVFARRHGYMKDTPAVLLASLTLRDPDLCRRAFPLVIDNGRMLRNFVQVLRAGVLGRKSLGSAPKRLVQQWLAGRSVAQLLNDAVGRSPSLADIIRMVHPRPADAERAALYGWLIGRPVDAAALPAPVRELLACQAALAAGAPARLPEVNFQWLTALPLTAAHWAEIARRASWQTLRMNLNTWARHGVFAAPALTEELAARLRDPAAVRRARVFPYQLFATWRALDAAVPGPLREALQDALEVALENVPALPGKVWVLADVSGSMTAPVTGYRRGATTQVSCVDAAALIASAILRRNPTAEVLPFDTEARPLALNPRDSVLTNAGALAGLVGGGTALSAPLAWLNRRKARGDLVLYVSDNQSWADTGAFGGRGPTATLAEWRAFRRRNPAARLVCLDLQPYAHAQVPAGPAGQGEVLHIGGFSDAVFGVIDRFARGEHDGAHWVAAIAAVEL